MFVLKDNKKKCEPSQVVDTFIDCLERDCRAFDRRNHDIRYMIESYKIAVSMLSKKMKKTPEQIKGIIHRKAIKKITL